MLTAATAATLDRAKGNKPLNFVVVATIGAKGEAKMAKRNRWDGGKNEKEGGDVKVLRGSAWQKMAQRC